MKEINANIAKKHRLAEAYQRSRIPADQMLSEQMKALQARIKAKEAEATANPSTSREQCIATDATQQALAKATRREPKALSEKLSCSIENSRKSFLDEVKEQILSNGLKSATIM